MNIKAKVQPRAESATTITKALTDSARPQQTGARLVVRTLDNAVSRGQSGGGHSSPTSRSSMNLYARSLCVAAYQASRSSVS
jgi:hypothetical protein